MDEYKFQRFITALFAEEPEIATSGEYGLRGQSDLGIDVIASRQDGDGQEAASCKRYTKISASQVRDWSDEFLKYWREHWSEKDVRRFVIATSAVNTAHKSVQDQVMRERERFLGLGIVFELWEPATLVAKVRPHRAIASTYLGLYWAAQICGPLEDQESTQLTEQFVSNAWTLPATPPPVGRDTLSAQLIEAMISGERRALLILGGPAIGKSTLALFAAHSPAVASHFGSRRCFIPLDQEGAADAKALKTSISRGVIGQGTGSDWKGALKEISREPSLIILDNLETSWEQDPQAVEECVLELSQCPGVTVCCTLRGAERPARVPWDWSIEIPRLSDPDAEELFHRISGRRDREGPSLGKLIAEMEGIPLAIELIAEQAQYTPVYELWCEWQSQKTAILRRPNRQRDRLSSLAVSLQLSYKSLRTTRHGRRLFRVLGRLPAGCSKEALRAILGAAAYEAATGLRRTRLAYDRNDKLVLLAPVREFASALPLSLADERKVSTYFLDLINHSAPGVGISNSSAGVNRLIEEGGNLESAMRLAIKATLLDRFDRDLLQRISDFQRFSGAGTPLILEEISDAAMRADSPITAARARLRAGEVYVHRSEYEPALQAFTVAEALFAKASERVSEATCIKCIGDALLDLGRIDEACRKFVSALRRYRRESSMLGEANCWSRLTDIAARRQDVVSASRCLKKARRLYRNMSDILGRANCIVHLAHIALLTRRASIARSRFARALSFYEAQGDLEGQGRAQLGLAAAVGIQKDRAAQIGHLRNAILLLERNQNRLWIGEAHFRMMQVAELHTVHDHRQAALEAWQGIGRRDLVERLA